MCDTSWTPFIDFSRCTILGPILSWVCCGQISVVWWKKSCLALHKFSEDYLYGRAGCTRMRCHTTIVIPGQMISSSVNLARGFHALNGGKKLFLLAASSVRHCRVSKSRFDFPDGIKIVNFSRRPVLKGMHFFYHSVCARKINDYSFLYFCCL